MINRRRFMKRSLQVGTGLLLSPSLPGLFLRGLSTGEAQAAGTDPDHFFLLITLPNPSSVDASYLFDARPQEMTDAKIIQNYRSKAGQPGVSAPWLGSNGASTLATDLVNPLAPLKDYFTVLNGVLMAKGFDGHDQNFNHLFTGNPFGGESFVPHLNLGSGSRPLDALARGNVKATLTNVSRIVPIGPKSGAALVARLAALPPLDPGASLFRHLRERFSAVASLSATGGISLGAQSLLSGLTGAPDLASMLTKLQITGDDTDANFIPMIAQFFKSGAARSAILSLNLAPEKFDTHDVTSASLQPRAYAALVNSLVQIMNAMRATPFDSSRSLMDVTTFMFSGEFSRTLRQNGKPIDQTGTDHNSLSNSILIGGKGIKGGQVIGASDYASSTEVLSPTHLTLDAAKLRVMGRPFDFATGLPRADLPAVYAASDYLGCNSVINTIYSAFGVPAAQWRLLERNAPVAPIVSALLS